MKYIVCYSGGHQRFWASAKKIINIKAVQAELPCECTR